MQENFDWIYKIIIYMCYIFISHTVPFSKSLYPYIFVTPFVVSWRVVDLFCVEGYKVVTTIQHRGCKMFVLMHIYVIILLCVIMLVYIFNVDLSLRSKLKLCIVSKCMIVLHCNEICCCFYLWFYGLYDFGFISIFNIVCILL